MKNLLKISLTAFALAALCGPVFAQDEIAETTAPPSEEIKAAAPAKPAPKKAAKKKPVKKKKQTPAPGSEYKFKAVDTPPSYRFDKKADPIIKHKSKAKVSSKKGKNRKKSSDNGTAATTDQPVQTLQKTPSIGEEAPANNTENNAENSAENYTENSAENNPEEYR